MVADIRGSDGVARGGGRDRDPQAVLYLSSAHFPQSAVSLVIRTDAQVQTILPAIRTAVHDVEPTLPILDLRRLDEWIADSEAQPRLTTTLAGAFAAAALFLTAMGIYGLFPMPSARRRRKSAYGWRSVPAARQSSGWCSAPA